MKKSLILLILGAFIVSGALFHSCKKDELRNENPSTAEMLKDASDYAFPIFMGKTHFIGHADIYIMDEAVHVDVILDPAMLGDYYPVEAHLYAAEPIPPTNAPGQFPNHWYEGDPYPISFVFDISEWWECEVFDWYFALHLELYNDVMAKEESAWLLPQEGGMNWLNPKGKPIGWGEYFLLEFNEKPVITDIELLYDPGTAADPPVYWMPTGTFDYDVPGTYPDYSMCLVPSNLYYYFDVGEMVIAGSMTEDVLNPFYLDDEQLDEDDPFGDFMLYWAGNGVTSGSSGGWQEVMYDIITGEAPMFYLKWDGMDYTLIDGLQYQIGQGEQPLRISGDYPNLPYYFYGTVQGEICDSDAITIGLTVGCP